MHVPSADELAAIAVAYLAVTQLEPTPSPASAEVPRWRLAGRLPELDPQLARFAARFASRWNAAGQLNG